MIQPFVIHNRGFEIGSYAIADLSTLDADELRLFSAVVEKVGVGLLDGEKITGGQLLERIKVSGDSRILSIVSRAMRTEHFADDYVLAGEFGMPLHRGTRADCEEAADALLGVFSSVPSTIERVSALSTELVSRAMMAMAQREALSSCLAKLVDYKHQPKADEWLFPHHFFDIDEGYAVCVQHQSAKAPCFDSRIFVRALNLLNLSSQHPRYVEFAQKDLEAHLYLFSMLRKNLGYSSLSDIATSVDFEAELFAHVIPHEHTKATLTRLLACTDTGLEYGDSDFFVSRRVSGINTEASVRPFEVLMPNGQIGWKMSALFVEEFVRREMCEHGEAAIRPDRREMAWR